jgi:hypothetical protein
VPWQHHPGDGKAAVSKVYSQARQLHANSQMGIRDIKRYCAVKNDAAKLLETT